MQSYAKNSYHLILLTIFSLLLLTEGCSSIPKPVGEMASAGTAISGAQSSEASSFAPVELDRAQTKLELAQKAVKNKDYATATRYAEEALADANLAKAKADAAKAKKAAQEMEQSINLLRKSLNLDTTTK